MEMRETRDAAHLAARCGRPALELASKNFRGGDDPWRPRAGRVNERARAPAEVILLASAFPAQERKRTPPPPARVRRPSWIEVTVTAAGALLAIGLLLILLSGPGPMLG